MENTKNLPRLRVPARASLWYIGSSVIARGIGVAMTPIFTRLLTPAEYGLYPLYNTWVGIFTVIVTLELAGAVIYRGLQKFSENKDGFISATFGLFLAFFLSICSLYFAFGGFFNQITGLTTPITFLLFLQIFFNTVIGFYIGRARFEYKYKSVVLLNLLSAIGIPLLSVLIILLTAVRGEARIIGASVTTVAIGSVTLFYLLTKSSKIFDKETWKFLLRFTLPLIPHYLAISLILRIGEITVERVYGTDALGRYSVAVSIGMALTVVTGGLLSALSPWILRKIEAKSIGKIREFLLLLTKGLSLTALLILAFAPEIMEILAAPEFRSALPAVYALEIAVVPMFLSNAVMMGEMYYERSFISAVPSILSAAVSILLTVTILPFIDYRFVSLFVLISYTVLAVLNALIFKKLSGETPIHTNETFKVLLLTIGYAAALFVFRNVLMSRIILTLPLLPILFIVGKKAIAGIKE